MNFRIKDELRSKCDGCIFAHTVKPHKMDVKVTMCEKLGMAVGSIKECNKFVSIIHSGPPMHMMMDALVVDPDRMAPGTAGFRGTPTKKFLTIDDVINADNTPEPSV